MTNNILLYIDPGTGSMLFAILIGIFGAVGYVLRMAWVKLRFKLSSGKKEEVTAGKTPYVIFSEGKRYWNVYNPICREFDKRGINVLYLSASEDDPGLNSGYPHIEGRFIGENNKAFSKLNFLNADIVISTTPGLDVYQWKRSRDVSCYVHIPHSAADMTLYRMFGIDYYDAILLNGQFQIDQVRKLEEIRNLPAKDLTLVGIPYMDDMVERLKSSGDNPEHEKTVLVAPSWGPSAIFSKFGSRILEALLKTGYHIIVRPHPQTFISEKDMIEKIMKEYPDSDQIEWNRDADNFEVLKRSDILISDFSAVVLDFALVYDKPIVYTDTKFDTNVYDAWWIDDEVWTLKILPKLGEKLTEENLSDVKDIIDKCLEDPKYRSGRDEVRGECWVNYGDGAEHAVDYLVKKYEEIKSK
ncbi:MAG: CDP-glycerol glycerophosphotransferase family protein [Lachnospiraceae bacterium]|nr:CDP-glycerol glycerophosphotransferase family protein [Lachnospiraceae bacterium]